MDTSLTIRPQIGVTNADVYRPPTVEAPVVRTVLPAGQAVTAAAQNSPSSTDPTLARTANPPAQSQAGTAQTTPGAATTSNQVVLDPSTREVIFRVIDTRSRQVVQQVPDEALRRQRAYMRALDAGKTPLQAIAQPGLSV